MRVKTNVINRKIETSRVLRQPLLNFQLRRGVDDSKILPGDSNEANSFALNRRRCTHAEVLTLTARIALATKCPRSRSFDVLTRPADNLLPSPEGEGLGMKAICLQQVRPPRHSPRRILDKTRAAFRAACRFSKSLFLSGHFSLDNREFFQSQFLLLTT